MQTALALLQLDSAGVAARVAAERHRNPFLRNAAAGPQTGDGAAALADTETARQNLLRQVGLIRFDAAAATLARDLVHCLDDRGFLTDSAQELCGYLGCRPATLDHVLARLQSEVEPAGLFARSLGECFGLQLRAANRLDPVIARLLTRLDLVARQDVPAICALCDADPEDALDMLADIRSLTPAPLSRLMPPPAPATGPDLFFDACDRGEIRVSLNPDVLPAVLTDDPLFSRITTAETDAGARAYYRDCHRSAGAFVLALQKRANTLLRIGRHIAGMQHRFLRTGRLLDRVPLTMETTAAALKLHKSTVSRAMAGCTIRTAHGTLPAAHFLVRPLNTTTAGKTRDQALRRLDLMIRTEDKARPLTDEALAALMRRANFAVSRRTVVKYRALLGQPGSSARRNTGAPRTPRP